MNDINKSKKEAYIPVVISSLKDCFKDIPFDIYLKLSDDKYVKAFDLETGIDFTRLAHYEAKNVKHFYVHQSHETLLNEFFSKSPLLILSDPNTSFADKRKAFWSSMEQTLSESLAIGNLSQLGIEKTFSALQAILESGDDFSKVLQSLMPQIAKKSIFYKHSITTAVYCYILTLISNMNSPRTQRILLFSAFFHDIGKLKLPEGRRIANQNTTPEEIAEFQKHPIFTLEMMKETLPFSDSEIRKCIVEHKERSDGKGYPHQLRGVTIYSLAKILSIADAMSELTLGLEDGTVYSAEQALSIMRNDSGRFDQQLLKKFAKATYKKDSSAA